MKKTLPVILSICALVLVVGVAPASAQTRTATVDLKRLFDNYWKTKQADAALKARGADLEKEFKAMADEYKAGKEAYTALSTAASDPAISDSERERKKQEAEDTFRNLKTQEEAIGKFKAQADATITEQRRRMRDNLLGNIRQTISSEARRASYTMVIDITAESINGAPVVLYSTGDNDITDAVLSQLNASAPPEALSEGSSSNTATDK